MKKTTRYIVFPVLASVLVWSVGSTGLAVDRSQLAAPRQASALSVASTAGGQSQVPVLLSTRPGQAQSVARLVTRLGGQPVTVLPGSNFVAAKVPATALKELEQSQSVRAMALDRPVALDKSAMQPLPERAAASAVPSASDPALSLKITRSEIRAPQLAQQTGNDGSGTVVAVLDTGVDPSHPALTKTSTGAAKIIDWQDFTGEGDVALDETRTQPIAGIPTAGGTYRLGTFSESRIPQGEMNSDINRNGRSDDAFRVLLTDSARKGEYDTAYVDTNLNGDFTDERPLRVYREHQKVGTFGSSDVKNGAQQGVNFVLTRIASDGSLINLGYDGGQHGTHVAGITAGSGPITGVAPGAQIMAIKVLTSGGSGSWSGIIQGMEYAATHGADIINMSLGGLAELNDGTDPQSLLVKELSEQHGVLFSIAAGNSGPGLNSVGLPGVAGAAVTSGAYISSNTWRADYGLSVPQDGLWYFSAAGPRDDGGLKPNLVAPGTANSAIPTWAGRYAVFQGTSMAAPQTSGAAALLVGAAKAQGLKVTPRQLTAALEAGARRLPGYGWYEQGHGLIQLDSAWAQLQQIAKQSAPDLVSFGKAKTGTSATGLYAREFQVGAGDAKWVLGNRSYGETDLALNYLPGNGLTVSGPARASLPGLQRREIPLQFDYAKTPGVYDALIQARVPGQAAPAAEYLATVVVPHEFEPARGNLISGIAGSIGPARYGRHFARVPAGTAELTVSLKVPGQQGRVRAMLYSPDGMPVGTGSPWAGAPDAPESQDLRVENPQPGVWEIDAYASHGGMAYGLAENKYELSVAARGLYATPARVDLAQSFGVTQTGKIHFANYYGDMTAVVAGAGFVQPTAQRLEVEQGGFTDQFLDVKPGTALLRASFAQVDDAGADLDLALYYNDPLNGWTRVGMVQGHRLGRQVQLLNPAPGQYAVEFVGKSVPARKTGFTYSLAVVEGGDAIGPVGEAASARRLGETWMVPVKYRTPATPGHYLGAIIVKDEATGKVLTVVPVELR